MLSGDRGWYPEGGGALGIWCQRVEKIWELEGAVLWESDVSR